MASSNIKVPVGTKSLATMMGLSESETRHFPSLSKVKEIVSDYNFGLITKKTAIDRLEAVKVECDDELYCGGIANLEKKIRYNY